MNLEIYNHYKDIYSIIRQWKTSSFLKPLINSNKNVIYQGLGRIFCQRDYGPLYLLDHIKGPF